MTYEKDKIERIPVNSRSWGELMLASIVLDQRRQKPNGWHWIFALINFLPFKIELIQDGLPEDHPLKLLKIPSWQDEFKKESVSPEATRLKKAMEKVEDDFITLPNHHRFYFSNLDFKDRINLSNFIFPMDANFDNSKFWDVADFTGAVFFRNANFKNTQFHGKTAKFREVTFKKIADFSDTRFEHHANFKDSNFKGRTIFQRATFKIHAPRFYEAKLSKEITWDNVNWPEFPFIFWALWQDILRRIKSKYADMTYVKNVRENQNAYEDLANHMEDLNKYHDQHLFFRLEMGCRRRLENYFTRLFYWLYERLSNYGYGVEYAIKAWFWHILICALILFAIRAFNRWNISLEDFGCSLGISLSNSHAFFFKGDRLAKCYETFEYLPWFNFIWGVQTITGTLLIFLVLLTLRIRFRLK